MDSSQSFVSINEGCEVLGVGRTTFNNLRKCAGFPKPRKLGGTVLRWRLAELVEWADSQKEGGKEQCSDKAQ